MVSVILAARRNGSAPAVFLRTPAMDFTNRVQRHAGKNAEKINGLPVFNFRGRDVWRPIDANIRQPGFGFKIK